VERSDTHRSLMMGFAALYPSYKKTTLQKDTTSHSRGAMRPSFA
jgi:hypothetical protein